MSRDLHKAPFDEGTKAKLAIFKDYLGEWLPVFLSKKEIYWDTINIFDFFSGPGSDNFGNNGTPLIILDELNPYFENISSKKLKVNLYFNEFDKNKFETLKTGVFDDINPRPFSIEVENLDFKIAFENQYPKMQNNNCANLLFLDRAGVKGVAGGVFLGIINLKRTGFLFFMSSSTIKRFSDHPGISQHIKVNYADIEKTPYHKIHRLVLEYYKSLIPKNKEYYLASFSLKKNAGLYGLIFGSGHVLGIEKFLTTCWSLDTERGEANFGVDDDRIQPGQIDMFLGEVPGPKKIVAFENELREKILNGNIKTDKEVYLFTLTNGIAKSKIKNIISQLTKENKIEKSNFDFSSKVCKANSIITQINLK
jgi:three-Cys-motif partner protein